MSAPSTAPVPPARVRRTADQLRTLIGIVLLAAAALCFGLRLATASHDRAWSAEASPRASYDLLVAQQYTLSSVAGPPETATAPLSCTIRSLDGPGATPGGSQPLALTPLSGDRITHNIATFIAPFTGSAQITCAPGPAVFVDDAQGVGRDDNAELMVIGIGLGVLGLLLASSAVVARRPETPSDSGSVAAGASTGTTVEAATGV